VGALRPGLVGCEHGAALRGRAGPITISLAHIRQVGWGRLLPFLHLALLSPLLNVRARKGLRIIWSIGVSRSRNSETRRDRLRVACAEESKLAAGRRRGCDAGGSGRQINPSAMGGLCCFLRRALYSRCCGPISGLANSTPADRRSEHAFSRRSCICRAGGSHGDRSTDTGDTQRLPSGRRVIDPGRHDSAGRDDPSPSWGPCI